MKIRSGFVTNSSSSSFTISHKKSKDKTLIDFISENYSDMKDHWLSELIKDISKADLLEQAEDIDKPIKNGQSFTFSDEGTTKIEHFLRYFCQDLDGVEDTRWEVERDEDYGGWY